MPINGDVSLNKDDGEGVQKVLKNLKRNTKSARSKRRKDEKNRGLINEDLRELLGCSPLGPSKKVTSKPKDQSSEELREI